MQHSLYHSLLRVATASLALVLLFDSGFVLPVTKELSNNTQLYLGNVVGVSAGVEATELSLMTAELTKKEQVTHDTYIFTFQIPNPNMNLGLNLGNHVAIE